MTRQYTRSLFGFAAGGWCYGRKTICCKEKQPEHLPIYIRILQEKSWEDGPLTANRLFLQFLSASRVSFLSQSSINPRGPICIAAKLRELYHVVYRLISPLTNYTVLYTFWLTHRVDFQGLLLGNPLLCVSHTCTLCTFTIKLIGKV